MPLAVLLGVVVFLGVLTAYLGQVILFAIKSARMRREGRFDSDQFGCRFLLTWSRWGTDRLGGAYFALILVSVALSFFAGDSFEILTERDSYLPGTLVVKRAVIPTGFRNDGGDQPPLLYGELYDDGGTLVEESAGLPVLMLDNSHRRIGPMAGVVTEDYLRSAYPVGTRLEVQYHPKSVAGRSHVPEVLPAGDDVFTWYEDQRAGFLSWTVPLLMIAFTMIVMTPVAIAGVIGRPTCERWLEDLRREEEEDGRAAADEDEGDD